VLLSRHHRERPPNPSAIPSQIPNRSGGTGRTRPVFLPANEHWSRTTSGTQKCSPVAAAARSARDSTQVSRPMAHFPSPGVHAWVDGGRRTATGNPGVNAWARERKEARPGARAGGTVSYATSVLQRRSTITGRVRPVAPGENQDIPVGSPPGQRHLRCGL